MPLSLLPPDQMIDMFMLEEDKLIAMWGIYMEGCKASYFLTGRNTRGELSDIGDTPNWDAHLEAMELQDLVDADDFKTPKKVWVICAMEKEGGEDYVEVMHISLVSP